MFQNRPYGCELTIYFRRNHRKAPKKHFEKFCVIHYLIGNFMLHSNLKSALRNIQNKEVIAK